MLHWIDCSKSCWKVNPFNTVLNPFCLVNLDRSDDTCPHDVGTCTCLDVNARYLDNTNHLARNDTTLIEHESVELLCLVPCVELDVQIYVVHDVFVCKLFDFIQLVLSNTFIVWEVYTCPCKAVLGTCLPNVLAEHRSCGRNDKVCSCVVARKGDSPVPVNFTSDFLADHIVFEFFIYMMKDNIVNLFCMFYFNDISVNGNLTYVGRLASSFRVKCCFIEDQTLVPVLFNHAKDIGLKLPLVEILIEQQIGFREVDFKSVFFVGCVLLVGSCNLCEEIVGNVYCELISCHLCDGFGRNSVCVIKVNENVKRHFIFALFFKPFDCPFDNASSFLDGVCIPFLF